MLWGAVRAAGFMVYSFGRANGVGTGGLCTMEVRSGCRAPVDSMKAPWPSFVAVLLTVHDVDVLGRCQTEAAQRTLRNSVCAHGLCCLDHWSGTLRP